MPTVAVEPTDRATGLSWKAIAVQNAAAPASSGPTDQGGSILPQMLIATLDSLRTHLSLIAPTEGEARFIAGSAARADEPQRGMPAALDRLAACCGYPLAREMIGAVVVAGPPVAVRIVGEPDATERSILAVAERYGVIVVETVTPPRHSPRDHSWYQPTIDAWRGERIEVLLIVIPPGVLPVWAAQLLTALGAIAAEPQERCLVLASDPALAMVLPPDALPIARDDHLSLHLTRALNRVRVGALPRRFVETMPLLARPEALMLAIGATKAACGTPCVYLDVAEGTTMIVANDDGVTVYHDAERDYTRGAIRLLNRGKTEQITRWIPFPATAGSLRTWALRRISSPLAPLMDDEDRAIAAALARAALHQALETSAAPIADGAMWMLGPGIARLGSHATALRFVADLLPAGCVAVVACDDADLFPAIGALAAAHPAAAASLLTHDALVPFGSVVQPSSARRHDRANMAATLTHTDGRTMAVDVAANALTTLPYPTAAFLSLTGTASNDAQLTVQGGPGGILVDTRRRPLTAVAPDPARPNVSGRLRVAATTGRSNSDE
ncbi:MAG: hypothetical protein LC793_13280 [Thermomicrobia bacterium]|nr:hypothetical protein [Thermomicrobia bacterium]